MLERAFGRKKKDLRDEHPRTEKIFQKMLKSKGKTRTLELVFKMGRETQLSLEVNERLHINEVKTD